MFTSLASSLRVVLISSPLNFNARMSLLTKRCVKRAWVAGAVGVGGGGGSYVTFSRWRRRFIRLCDAVRDVGAIWTCPASPPILCPPATRRLQ